MSEKIIINNWLKCYLIGAMSQTKADDGGSGWREKLSQELISLIDINGNPVYIFNPCTSEKDKVGLSPKEFHKKIKGWLSSGNNDKVAEGSDLIWNGKTYIEKDELGDVKLIKIPGDNDFVENSDFLVLRIEEGDKPCVAKNTKVLMADWTQKNVQDVKVGDKIIGFEKLNGKTILKESIVYRSIKTGYRKCINVSDDKNNKIKVTEDHKFLTKNKKKGSVYTEVKNISNAFSLINEPTNKDFLKGWLTGYFQNDGCFSENWQRHSIIVVSNKQEEILRVKEILDLFNFSCAITSNKNKESKTKIYKLVVGKRGDYFELSDWARNHPPSRTFIRGWLAGAIDADGCIGKEYIEYSQSKINIDNIKIFKDYCKKLNIHYSVHFRKRDNLKIFGRKIKSSGEYSFKLSKTIAFLIPSQLKYKRDKFTLSIDKLNSNIKIEKSNRTYVYDLTTSTGNFVANGFIVHNCGTFFEAGYGNKLKIPIYVLQTMPRENYPESLVGWIFGSGGKFFDNSTQLIDFLKDTYKLKIKKEDKNDNQKEKDK